MTKMTDAFKKVFLGLGGDPKKLAENNDVGDYIVDLESAIKEYVNEAATAELPTPAEANVGKVATVVSDGEGGYEWSAENAPEVKAVTYIGAMSLGSSITIGDYSIASFDDLYSLYQGNNNLCLVLEATHSIKPTTVTSFMRLEMVRKNESNQRILIFKGIVGDVFNDTLYQATATFTESLTGTYSQTAIT
jgi:hypothetical protein